MRSCAHYRLLRAALALLLVVQFGCSAANRPSWLQEPGWNKPWSYRSGVAAAVCAALGAGTGVGIQQARTSCATVVQNGVVVGKDCQSLGDSNDSTYWVWGALIGAASGAVLCGVLGHVFLDPAEEPPIPPPPPVLAEAQPVTPPIAKRIVLRGVTFDFNSSTLRQDSLPVLDQAVSLLKENPRVDVVVEGYTDSVGSESYNQALSLRRAEAVYRYLVNQGVTPERMQVEGFGEANPVATNDTEVGRAQNRRVELKVKP